MGENKYNAHATVAMDRCHLHAIVFDVDIIEGQEGLLNVLLALEDGQQHRLHRVLFQPKWVSLLHALYSVREYPFKGFTQ